MTAVVKRKSGCPEGKGWKRWRTGGTTKLFDPTPPVSTMATGDQMMEAVQAAFTPNQIAAKVKTLADMSEEEIRELERKLGAKLSPNAKRSR